jgi:thymidylate synthase ThyX
MSYSQKHFFDEVKDVARGTYEDIVDELTPVVGRKQARGAARGFLGNALSTELIFSASVAQWRRMIAQRDNEAADAEIRDLFCNYITPVVEGI